MDSEGFPLLYSIESMVLIATTVTSARPSWIREKTTRYCRIKIPISTSFIGNILLIYQEYIAYFFKMYNSLM